MTSTEWENVDAICSVLSEQRSSEHAYNFIDHYLKSRELLNSDYLQHPINPHAIFTTEKEMITCFADTPEFDATIFFNGVPKELSEKIMLGINFTSDGKTIYSITCPADGHYEYTVLSTLETFLYSEISLLHYNTYPGHHNGAAFLAEWRTR